MIRIVIEGEPIPAARPRYSVRRVYQPRRKVDISTKDTSGGTRGDDRQGTDDRRIVCSREVVLNAADLLYTALKHA